MADYYERIKQELLNNEISKLAKRNSINKGDLTTYYNVGKMLNDAGKNYGENIIKTYSQKLSSDIGNGYGVSNLKRMRQFYLLIEKGVAMPHQLTWSHILTILPVKDVSDDKTIGIIICARNNKCIIEYC